MQVIANQFVCRSGFASLMTWHLLTHWSISEEAKELQAVVARHDRKIRVVDCSPVDARRRAGLQPVHAESQRLQERRKSDSWEFTGSSRRHRFFANPNGAFQECSCTEHHS